jgi:DNA-binding protein YbaB
MQKKMQKIQDDLALADFEGSAGGGMVKVIISGAGLAKKIVIDDSLINKLFTSETEKPEIQNMNRLFNSGELIH